MRKQSSPTTQDEAKAPSKECFVIMPISDHDSYSKGHFQRVYEDLTKPACLQAGFKPVRADEVKESNLIHLDILKKLLSCEMAVCDLSSQNPNVLFELALRQAFDKPVALIQEEDSKPIFDIAPLRFTKYRKALLYREVIEDQKRVADAISETSSAFAEKRGVNSIVKLLALSESAQLPELSGDNAKSEMFQVLMAEIGALRAEIGKTRWPVEAYSPGRIREGFDLQFSQFSRACGQLQSVMEIVEELLNGGPVKELATLQKSHYARLQEAGDFLCSIPANDSEMKNIVKLNLVRMRDLIDRVDDFLAGYRDSGASTKP